MTISTKGRYALSYLIDLAEVKNGQPQSVKDSAERCEISEKYLEHIVATLSRNHIIRSIRGPKGGYVLAIEPKDCTVGRVLRVMEGSLCVAPCLEDMGQTCDRSKKCTNVILWKKMDDALNSVVDNITIADMCDWKKESV